MGPELSMLFFSLFICAVCDAKTGKIPAAPVVLSILTSLPHFLESPFIPFVSLALLPLLILKKIGDGDVLCVLSIELLLGSLVSARVFLFAAFIWILWVFLSCRNKNPVHAFAGFLAILLFPLFLGNFVSFVLILIAAYSAKRLSILMMRGPFIPFLFVSLICWGITNALYSYPLLILVY